MKLKEVMEENSSLAKVHWKQTPNKGKDIQKMLQWIQMGFKEEEWVENANLGGLFAIHWTIPRRDLLEEFLCTWESIEDGWIQIIVCDEKITIDQTTMRKSCPLQLAYLVVI